MNPKLSVITPTYNRAKMLPETIRSIQAQTFTDYEYIIVDDGSTDDTEDIVRAFMRKDSRIRYFKHPNMGESKTSNRGYKEARGELSVIINSDDPLYSIYFFQYAIEKLDAEPDLVAVYSDWFAIGENSEVLHSHGGRWQLPEFDIKTLLLSRKMTALGLGMMIRMDALRQIGFRDETIRYTGDLNISFKLARIGRLGHLPLPLATHRYHPGCEQYNSVRTVHAKEILDLYLNAYIGQWPLPPPLSFIEKAKMLSMACMLYKSQAQGEVIGMDKLPLENRNLFNTPVRDWLILTGLRSLKLIWKYRPKQAWKRLLAKGDEPCSYSLSCSWLRDVLVLDDGGVRYCCVPHNVNRIPRVNFSDCEDFQELCERSNRVRNNALNNLKNGAEEGYCAGCQEAKWAWWPDKLKIKRLEFNTGFLCQFNCVYCTAIHARGNGALPDADIECTKRAIDYIKYLCKSGVINDKTMVVISTGEITINPLQDELMELFQDNPCCVLTNGAVYSLWVEKVLGNDNSFLNISLDSGTPETFIRVKGVNLFDKVCENIRRYSKYGRIELKYILIPGLNDNFSDFKGFLDLAEEIGAEVVLSRDNTQSGLEHLEKNISKALVAISHFVSAAKDRELILHALPNLFDGKFSDKIRDAVENPDLKRGNTSFMEELKTVSDTA